jgi:hypothetical protein
MPSEQAPPPWWHGAVIDQLYVRSYLGVHPELGTLPGLDELIVQAGRQDRDRPAGSG